MSAGTGPAIASTVSGPGSSDRPAAPFASGAPRARRHPRTHGQLGLQLGEALPGRALVGARRAASSRAPALPRQAAPRRRRHRAGRRDPGHDPLLVRDRRPGTPSPLHGPRQPPAPPHSREPARRADRPRRRLVLARLGAGPGGRVPEDDDLADIDASLATLRGRPLRGPGLSRDDRLRRARPLAHLGRPGRRGPSPEQRSSRRPPSGEGTSSSTSPAGSL